MHARIGRVLVAVAVAAMWLATVAVAQETLPKVPPPLTGYNGLSTQDSSPPEFPQPLHAPKGAPNVLLILADDVGFSAASTFGGPIRQETLDALAKNGLRYNVFHTTAVCSATRAALMTGRNHHMVNVSLVVEGATGYDGYTGIVPKSAGTIAQVLKGNGYNTALFGKWHLTPLPERGQNGPFDHWPIGMGFEYFYGYLAGTNQWAPPLYEITTPIEADYHNPGYHLDRDLADHAIKWIKRQKSLAPDQPFFVYYATASGHAPHDSPFDWTAKYKGQFDQGWDKLREETLARQKKLGIIPQNTQLTPRPPEIPAWDSLSADEKAVYAREMEVYAGMMSHSDYNIGRVIDAIRETGQLDNTLIIYIEGDNGASSLGGQNGSLNDQALMQGVTDDIAYLKAHLDEMGGPMTRNEYALGWGHAMDAPFQFWKSIGSHFGGTRNGLVISWPARIKDKGGIRSQFHHVIDIMPTILEAASIQAPASIDGVPQQPIQGTSMVYTFDNANAPSHRTTQYFDLGTNVALYHDGWIACSRRPTPADGGMLANYASSTDADDLEARKWELYHVTDDFSEAVDLAQQEPKKLRQLEDLFFVEAGRNHLLPIHRDDFSVMKNFSTRKNFTYFGRMTRTPEGVAPNFDNKSYDILADVEVPAAGGDGMLVTTGGRFLGFGFYLLDGKLTYTYSWFNKAHYSVVSPDRIAPGHHVLAVAFAYDGGGYGKGGTATLKVDGKAVASGRIEHTSLGLLASQEEDFDVGDDTGTPVSEEYKTPFPFQGTINSVAVTLKQ